MRFPYLGEKKKSPILPKVVCEGGDPLTRIDPPGKSEADAL